MSLQNLDHYGLGHGWSYDQGCTVVYIPIAPLTVPNNTDPCVGVMPSPGCCMTKEPGINKNVHQITDNLIVAV